MHFFGSSHLLASGVASGGPPAPKIASRGGGSLNNRLSASITSNIAQNHRQQQKFLNTAINIENAQEAPPRQLSFGPGQGPFGVGERSPAAEKLKKVVIFSTFFILFFKFIFNIIVYPKFCMYICFLFFLITVNIVFFL